jgi:hypothetical protein
MTATAFFTTQVKGTMDVALARINLRKQLMTQVQCNIRTIARSTVALTALGELIMSTRPSSSILLTFSITQPPNDTLFLQFDCKFNGDVMNDGLFLRYRHNLEKVTDGTSVQVDDGITKVQGFIRIVK